MTSNIFTFTFSLNQFHAQKLLPGLPVFNLACLHPFPAPSVESFPDVASTTTATATFESVCSSISTLADFMNSFQP
jgi:hypothetical protein